MRKSRSHALVRLAASLVRGARRELDLTPKPGLVDRLDNGSHPDLTYAAMRESIALLPRYYADLSERLMAGAPLISCVEAGRLAEDRMLGKVGANTHRGYIFLSGLVLVAAHHAGGDVRCLPEATARAAQDFFRVVPRGRSHGADAAERFGVAGVREDAEAGLPCVFAGAWPRYRAGLKRDGDARRAAFHALAVLMQRVEDTTAVHRCGMAGLQRVRGDGRALEALLTRGEDATPFLTACNEEYRASGLTMGGVADCLALTFALDSCFSSGPRLGVAAAS
jgi:triphosphoribosyl-dephospho-CoA synthase